MRKNKYKVRYEELPTFEEFVDKKKIRFVYSFMEQLLGVNIYVYCNSIIMDYFVYDKCSLAKYKEEVIEKIVYPLTSKAYKKVKAKLLYDQFSTNVASDLGVSVEEIREVYSKLKKIFEEENENEGNN